MLRLCYLQNGISKAIIKSMSFYQEKGNWKMHVGRFHEPSLEVVYNNSHIPLPRTRLHGHKGSLGNVFKSSAQEEEEMGLVSI